MIVLPKVGRTGIPVAQSKLCAESWPQAQPTAPPSWPFCADLLAMQWAVPFGFPAQRKQHRTGGGGESSPGRQRTGSSRRGADKQAATRDPCPCPARHPSLRSSPQFHLRCCPNLRRGVSMSMIGGPGCGPAPPQAAGGAQSPPATGSSEKPWSASVRMSDCGGRRGGRRGASRQRRRNACQEERKDKRQKKCRARAHWRWGRRRGPTDLGDRRRVEEHDRPYEQHRPPVRFVEEEVN